MTPAPPTPAIRHRFHLLDALRGIAALLVIAVHAPPYMQARFAPRNDFLAVDFFFCLSGFVIAHSYQRRLQEGMTIREFFRARMLRLYPVYLLGTAIGLTWALTLDRHLFRPPALVVLSSLGLLILPNLSARLSTSMFPLDLPAWSLLFEILVNLAFAVLARGRLAKVWLLALCIVGSSVAVAYWVGQGGALGNLGWSSQPELFGPELARGALSFAAGLLLHKLYVVARKRGALAPSTIALPLLVTCSFVFLLRAPLHAMQTAGFHLLCITLLFPLLVLLGAYSRIPRSLNGTCAALGDLSYPLYLLHVPLLRLLGLRHVTVYAAQHPVLVLPLLLSSVLFLAFLSYLTGRFYDAPVRRRLSRPDSRPILHAYPGHPTTQRHT